jgi:hypothetical protein
MDRSSWPKPKTKSKNGSRIDRASSPLPFPSTHQSGLATTTTSMAGSKSTRGRSRARATPPQRAASPPPVELLKLLHLDAAAASRLVQTAGGVPFPGNAPVNLQHMLAHAQQQLMMSGHPPQSHPHPGSVIPAGQPMPHPFAFPIPLQPMPYQQQQMHPVILNDPTQVKSEMGSADTEDTATAMDEASTTSITTPVTSSSTPSSPLFTLSSGGETSGGSSGATLMDTETPMAMAALRALVCERQRDEARRESRMRRRGKTDMPAGGQPLTRRRRASQPPLPTMLKREPNAAVESEEREETEEHDDAEEVEEETEEQGTMLNISFDQQMQQQQQQQPQQRHPMMSINSLLN